MGYSRIALALWIVTIGTDDKSQTIELRSVMVSALNGPERERFLARHNVARQKVGVDPVEWSDELSKYALESITQQKDALIGAAKEGWAKGLAVMPKHRVDDSYGENVAGWVGGRSQSAELAVNLWLGEKATFDKLNAIAPYRVGDAESKSETDATGKERPIVVGHYTAIVWRATKQIGAAKLSFDLIDGQGNVRSYVAIICNYSPPGNRRGEKPY